MRKSSMYSIFGMTALIIVFIQHSELAGLDTTITPEQSEKIIEKIYEKYAPVYKKYEGTQSTRQVDVIEYNPNTNQLVNRSSVSLIRKEYFYKKSEITVLQFTKNDKPMPATDYQSREEQPGPPVLDQEGKNIYSTRITRSATISNLKCYQMEVFPRKKTPLLFEGFFYFKCDTLDLVLVEGTTAELSYPLKEFSMKLYFDMIKDLPVLRTGSFIMRVYIPVLQPDRRFVICVKVLDNKPLKKIVAI
jgi:hypothetical protein